MFIIAAHNLGTVRVSIGQNIVQNDKSNILILDLFFIYLHKYQQELIFVYNQVLIINYKDEPWKVTSLNQKYSLSARNGSSLKSWSRCSQTQLQSTNRKAITLTKLHAPIFKRWEREVVNRLPTNNCSFFANY